MNVRETPPEHAPPHKEAAPPYPAEKARGATINLPTRTQKIIFFSGLVAAFLIALALRILAPLH